MENKATTTPTIEEKDYKGFTFQNITFNTKNGISGIITLNGFDYTIKNNNIVRDDVVSRRNAVSSSPGKIDTTEKDIMNVFQDKLKDTGIRVKIVP